jgi:hypothetical protein
LPPTDDKRRKPRARKPAAQKPAARKAAGREPVARKAVEPVEPATNGHAEWVDYGAQTTSWDPWDEGGEVDDAEARGLNRTLGEWLEAVVPPEAQIHFFNAGREFAAGIQTTVEHHLHRGDEDDSGGAQALRIEIE